MKRRGIIEAYARTGDDMAEEALKGDNRRREEAEERLGVATEVLERAAEDAERREVQEALRRAEEGGQLKFQRLVVEWRIDALDRMGAKRLEAELWQEAKIRQEADLLQPEVKTTDKREESETSASEEEEARDKDDEDDSGEGTMTSG